jgi:cytochrome bd-type quinol oxidase subunit 2
MLIGFVASLVTSFELISLFRDELRYRCTFVTMGDSDAGSFACADGIGYLMIVIAIHGVSVILMLGFAVIVFGPPTPKVQSRSARVAGLAVVPVAFFIAATAYTVVQRPADDARNANYWVGPMLPATIILGVGIALIAVASTTTHARVRCIATACAALALVGAAVAQPGALPSVAMSLGLLLAEVFLRRGELMQKGPGLPTNKGVPAE